MIGCSCQVEGRPSYLPPSYQANGWLRAAVIIGTIAAVCITLLALTGSLTSFPQDVSQFIQSINWTHVGSGEIAFVVLTAGAFLAMHKALKREDPLTDTHCGAIQGNKHWVAGGYIAEEGSLFKGYIDKSTLDEQGSGMAYIYAFKEENEHMGVAMAVLAFSPLFKT